MEKEKCWVCGELTEQKQRDWANYWFVIEDEEDVEKYENRQQQEIAQGKFGVLYERIFCDECFVEFLKDKKSNATEYTRLKTIIMHERAIRYMEKSRSVFLCDLKEASDHVLRQALKTNCYMSSHEMITAMILYDEAIDYEAQALVGKHRVDFLLPQIKAVVEVDGYMHNYRKKEDQARDAEVKRVLGSGWEVVRIKTEQIEENPSMIFPAIEQLLDYKRKETQKVEKMLLEHFKETNPRPGCR